MMYLRFNFTEDWYNDALFTNIDTEVHLYITFNNSGFTQEFIRFIKQSRIKISIKILNNISNAIYLV